MMPTIGVGLVGLMVTAGLASYFLYPFGAARRIYEVDRKDKGGSYSYNDIYSGGIAEEEALGKVIAGMPFDKLQSSFYKSPTTRKATPTSTQEGGSFYPNYRKPQTQHFHQSNIHNYQTHHHHNKQRGVVHGTVESVPIGPSKGDYLASHYEKDSYQPITYRNQNSELIKDNEVNSDKNSWLVMYPKKWLKK
ncbi:hypothetical protein WA026_006374 [Henosepilachna vigintioctopunctata]|uniref:Transmembrane protein n=1 Tax=Henosepilachna vigintioctopunctata TaxID=420089 RepID=A0AAW1TQE7_9CUCU